MLRMDFDSNKLTAFLLSESKSGTSLDTLYHILQSFLCWCQRLCSHSKGYSRVCNGPQVETELNLDGMKESFPGPSYLEHLNKGLGPYFPCYFAHLGLFLKAYV